ncbi:unnamed protein product [Cladocopium goreaui]|uniref:J domain-containing protein n=1 Tax=Cladocopium goreaui TaxID=2562237 RepID=A0A9P1C300_9DINO|nr:unnamed protein product [Cladocopium goreaui]
MQSLRCRRGLECADLFLQVRRHASSECPNAKGCRACRRVLGLHLGPLERTRLREAFRQAAWQHHPDSASKLAGANFAELRRCYEMLLHCCGKISEGGSKSDLAKWLEDRQTATVEIVKRSRQGRVARQSAGLVGCPKAWDARLSAARTKVHGPEALEVVLDIDLPSELPRFLWTAAAEQGIGPLTGRGLRFCGSYRRGQDFNAAASYVNRFGFYLFWSQLFSDWKIANRLSEKGACTAFVDGGRDKPPWSAMQNGRVATLQWAVWDPSTESFAKQPVLVRPL